MPRTWDTLAHNPGNPYEVEDFKRAAYRLITEQALYEFIPKQRLSYRIVKEHKAAYTELCGLMGMELRVEANQGYCCARPVGERTTPLKLGTTLMALVLRRIYHHKMQAGEDQAGRVLVSLPDLAVAYRDATHRDLTLQRNELDPLFDQMRRFGIARTTKADLNDGQPMAIEILPAIEFLIDETYLADLNGHAMQAQANGADPDAAGDMDNEEDDDETA
ncbi:MAG: hypothetical protein CMN28_14555 [Salinisphaeraceae bacterium]|jgi:hypothetical protein|nr:hypothetical protein [Salinisphaeraceae bacterium]